MNCWTVDGDRCYGSALERLQLMPPGRTCEGVNDDVVSLAAIVSQLVRAVGKEAFEKAMEDIRTPSR